jgi:molecular chaperone DnaK
MNGNPQSRGSSPGQPPLGIDLGTTYSAVAGLDPAGNPATIPNALGDLSTPSAVLVTEDGVIVGREAARGAVLDPDAYADCFKRDMGAAYYHRKLCGLEVPPEVLSALVLQQLKQETERFIGPVRQAVITVPAFFDESRRKATQDAGRLAGLDVLDIINEPTAAAIAFGHRLGCLSLSLPGEMAPQRVLVYDLGGGTFDVTILEITGDEFRARATDGDVRLGGKDFDERLVDHIAEQFRKAHGTDPRSDPQDAAQLWSDAQLAKHTLSQRTKASLACAYGGIRLRLDLTREEFEDLTRDLLDRTETTTSLLVRQAGLDWSQIDRVLLVGGSSRMPMVSAMLQRLTGRDPDRSISPDEAVAHGAALYAGMLMRGPDSSGPQCRLVNVNSHSLGVVGIDVATRRRINCIIIPRNTPLPCRVARTFVTERDNQRGVRVAVVEGESPRPEDCIRLGECVVRDLPEGLPKGTPIRVEYSYAANGRIAVAARVSQASQSAHVAIDRPDQRPLEGLDVWDARLRRSRQGMLPGGEDGPAVKLSDRASISQRLGFLYAKIGRVAVDLKLSRRLAACQKSAQDIVRQATEAQQRLAQAEAAKLAAASATEAMRLGSAHVRAKSEVERFAKDLEAALIALGRECVRARVVPEPVKPQADEIERLTQHLLRQAGSEGPS